MTLSKLHFVYLIGLFLQLMGFGIFVIFIIKTKKKKFFSIILSLVLLLSITFTCYWWFINYSLLKGRISFKKKGYTNSIVYYSKASSALKYVNLFSNSRWFVVVSKKNISNDLGYSYSNIKDYKNTIYHLENSLKFDTQQFRPHVYLAEAYFKVGDIDKSVYYHNKIINYPKQEYYDYYYHVGKSYLFLELYEKSIKAYKKALQLKPNNYEINYYIALCYSELNKPEKALDHLKILFTYDIQNVDSIVNSGLFKNVINKKEFKEIVKK